MNLGLVTHELMGFGLIDHIWMIFGLITHGMMSFGMTALPGERVTDTLRGNLRPLVKIIFVITTVVEFSDVQIIAYRCG